MKNWKPRRDRFIVKECPQCCDDHVFKNNLVVFNQNLGMAYGVNEIVEVLNNQGLFSDYFNELMQIKIWFCQMMYHKTNDEKYKIEEECLKLLREESRNESSIFKYSDILNKEHMESKDERSKKV